MSKKMLGCKTNNLFMFVLFFVTDEREDVQKKTFAKWINSQLLKVSFYYYYYFFV